MLRPMHAPLLIVAALALAACSDAIPTPGNTLLLNQAFQSVPMGFSANSNTFDPAADHGTAFFPGPMAATGMQGGGMGQGGPMGGRGQMGGPGGGRHVGGGDHHDGFGPGMRDGMMGGGLGPEFMGLLGFGHGRHGGPFGTFALPADCTFDAASGRVTCPDVTERGLTISRSFAFKTATGTAQASFDTATTDLVNVATTVRGTRTRRDSSTSTVLNTSDRTVKGLAPGSTERTVNGTSRAEETTNGTRDGVAFTAARIAGDTTLNLVIPVDTGRPPIPKSGTVIREMTVTINPAGGTATTRSRREVITYNGTNVVTVQITQDGVTRNCTITLPDRRPVCE